MRSGTLNEEGEKETKKRRKNNRDERWGGWRDTPEVADFAHNYNPASEILQFADVAKISRHNDHDRGEARFMNMRLCTRLVFILGGTFCSAAYAYIPRDANLRHDLPSRMRILDRGNDRRHKDE